MDARSFPSVLVVLSVAMIACGGSDEASSEAVPTSAVAFLDVNVVPMDSERIIEAQTVVVLGTRIVAIGPVGETEVPEGARRIDGSGRYLMPGLADMHAHVDEDGDLLLFLANGVTTVRNMAGGPAHLERRQRIARGELLGPTMYTAGPVIDGPVELWPGNAAPPLPPDAYEVIERSRDGERVVREQTAAGYDFIKVYDNLPAEAYEGVATAARDLGIPIAGHVPFGVGLAVALTDLASIEHLRGYIYELFADSAELSLGWDKRSRFLAWNHIDTTRFARVVQATVDAGIWNVPTLTRYQKNMMPTEDHLRRYTSPEASYVNPAIIQRMLSGRSFTENAGYGSFVEADFVAGRRVFQMKKAFVKALHDAGANILLGSDDWFAGFATQQELQNLVDAGLTPYQAIATGTTNAAVFLEAADEFGTVAVGMTADLVLLEDDPLTNVRHLQNRTGVMVQGRWFTEGELKQMLDQLAASYRGASPGRP